MFTRRTSKIFGFTSGFLATLFFIIFVFNQLSSTAQICYMQEEDGSIIDLTSLCQRRPRLPVQLNQNTFESITEESAAMDRVLVSLSSRVNEICAQFPNRCNTQSDYLNELNPD